MNNNKHWGYDKSNGPETWGALYPIANGKRQSPIDIDANNTEKISADNPLTVTFLNGPDMILTNTGHGWQVSCDGWGEMKGGPLTNNYRLIQFHCHWGDRNEEGSEHAVLGKKYAAELHLVHWNADKYETVAEAANQPDGLAVLAVFLEIGDRNKELEKVCRNIRNVEYQEQRTTINESVDLSKLLPPQSDYWSYFGSLTTPPCNESVVWIVYKAPMQVSESQLCAFRYLKCHCQQQIIGEDTKEKFLMRNARPTVPTGERVVREYRSEVQT